MCCQAIDPLTIKYFVLKALFYILLNNYVSDKELTNVNLWVNNMIVVLREVRQGRAHTIFAMGSEKRCQLLDFLRELATSDRDEFGKITALLDRTADNGIPRNELKCRYFRNLQMFELKTAGGVRVMAFWDVDKMIVCSHGFMKKSPKTPTGELERAEKLKQEYFEAKYRGELRIE